MKYVLVDRGDNIIDKVDIDGDLKKAEQFFIERKQIDKKDNRKLINLYKENLDQKIF